MRWAALALFMVFIAIIDVVIIQRRDAYPVPPAIASRELAAGVLLEPGDLRPQPPVGRYTRTAVHKGDKVSDLTDAPTLPAPAPGNMIIGLPAERALVAGGVINAGTPVMVCRGGAPLAPQPMTVEAVICPADGTACTAMIEGPAASVATFATAANDPIKVRPAGASKPCW